MSLVQVEPGSKAVSVRYASGATGSGYGGARLQNVTHIIVKVGQKVRINDQGYDFTYIPSANNISVKCVYNTVLAYRYY